MLPWTKKWQRSSDKLSTWQLDLSMLRHQLHLFLQRIWFHAISYATLPIWKITRKFYITNSRLTTLIIFLISKWRNSSSRQRKNRLLVIKFSIFSNQSQKQPRLSAMQVESLRWEKRSSPILTHNKLLDQTRKTCIEDVRLQPICRNQKHHPICRSLCLMQISFAKKPMIKILIGLSALGITTHNLS